MTLIAAVDFHLREFSNSHRDTKASGVESLRSKLFPSAEVNYFMSQQTQAEHTHSTERTYVQHQICLDTESF